MESKFNIGDKVSIRKGTIVGQDMRFYEWDDESIVFEIDYIEDDGSLARLTAPGFGRKDNYGNGAVYCKASDLILVKKKET